MLKGRESRLLGLVAHHLADVLPEYGCSSDTAYLGSHVGTSRNRGRQEHSEDADDAEGRQAVNLLRRLMRHSITFLRVMEVLIFISYPYFPRCTKPRQ